MKRDQLSDRLVSALEDVLLDEERGGLGGKPSRRRVAEVLAHEAGKHEAAENERLREALEKIAAVENTKIVCVRHGGTVGADDPDACWCGISLDAAEKARLVAREALNGGERMAEQVDLPVIAHDDDGMEHCPTCGSLVCVVQDDDREGTSHYEPVGSQGVERLAEQLRGAVEAIDDAVHVILDALSALHPEPAKRLMETASYKAFAAYVKRGQSETRRCY